MLGGDGKAVAHFPLPHIYQIKMPEAYRGNLTLRRVQEEETGF